MDWSLSFVPFAAAYLVTSIIALFVAGMALQRRDARGGKTLTFLMLSITEWSLAAALELNSVSLETKIFWSKMGYPGTYFTPVFLTIFALQFTNNERWLTRRNMIIIWSIPLITILLAFTNEYHHLIWTSFTPSPHGHNLILYGHGSWFWLSLIHLYALLLITNVLFFRAAVRLNRVYRKQMIALLITIPLTWAGNAVYVFDLGPISGLDLTPITFSLAGAILVWSFYQLHLFDLAPIARHSIIEEMEDILLVFDSHNRVIDYNQAACQIIREIHKQNLKLPETAIIGHSIEEIFSDWQEIQQCLQTQHELDTEIKLDIENERRFFDVKISPLLDHEKQLKGKAAVLRDITIKQAIQFSEIKSRQIAEATQEASLTLVSTLEFDQVLDRILEQIAAIISLDSASVILREDNDLINVRSIGFEEPELVVGRRFPLDEESPNKRVFEEQHAIIIPDVQSIYSSFREYPHNKIKSWLGVPLIFQGNFIGMLTLDSHEYNHFSLEDMNIANAFASPVTIALENARAYTASQRRITELSIINEIIHSITSKLALSELMKTVLQQIIRIMDIPFLMIASYDQKTDSWTPLLLKDDRNEFTQHTYTSKEGLTGYTIQSRQPIMINTVEEQLKFSQKTNHQHIGIVPNAFISVPLLVENKVIGVMTTQHYDKQRTFSKEDFSLLQLIGSQIAVAIENARLFEQVSELAVTDTLTNLANRRHFFELAQKEIERAIRYQKPLHAIMLDIDHFKQVNDTWGHLIGDKVLSEMAHTCLNTLRKVDIIGRYGGEEFVILLPETDLTAALEVAERLRKNIAKTQMKISDTERFYITVSLGVAGLNDEDTKIETLLDRADKAMYAAKRNGRNGVVNL